MILNSNNSTSNNIEDILMNISGPGAFEFKGKQTKS
jgi:hypothetical protein